MVPGVRVVALADSGTGRARVLCPPGCQAFTDWRSVLDVQDLDILVIATPPKWHKEIALAALDRRIAVLCEKPMGLHAAQAQAMCEMALKQHCKGWVGFQFRYEPGIVKFLELIKSGEIGAVTHVFIRWVTSGRSHPSRPWSWQNDATQGGGVINAFLSHVIDLLYSIAETTAINIRAEGQILISERVDLSGNFRQVTAEDLVRAHFDFDCGITAEATISNCVAEAHGFEIEAVGKEGSIRYFHRPPFTQEDLTLTMKKYTSDEIRIVVEYIDHRLMDSRIQAASGLAQSIISEFSTGKNAGVPSFSDGLIVRRALDSVHKVLNKMDLQQ